MNDANQVDESPIRMLENQSRIIEEVETFIQRMRDLDYVIDSKDAPNFFQTGNMGLLANAITDYELNRGDNPTTKWTRANECFKWINRAFAHGVIKEGEGLINKSKECSRENVRLNERIEILSENLMKAKERIEELEQMMPNFCDDV